MSRDTPCPHYPRCYGCPLIGTPYGEQLERKRGILREAFAPYASLAGVEVPELVGSPRAFGYRNQAKLVARDSRRGLLLGIYKPGTHEVVDIRRCPIHAPPINDVLERVAEIVERFEVPIYDETARTGWLRYVVVRTSLWKKDAQIILVGTSRALPGLREMGRKLGRIRGVSSVVVNINRDPGNVIFGPEFAPMSKEDGLVEKIGGLRLRTRAGAFLQANPNIAGRIYRQAVEWAALEPTDVAVDLYCGAGAMTFHLAERAHTVFGIEASPIAIIDAKRNARMNGIGNTRFQAGEAGPLLAELVAHIRPAVVVLNPPRKGADEATREAIVAAAPRRIVYVSCAPATLARDLDWFAERGYGTQAVRGFDMMPQTEHVETVALLVRDADEKSELVDGEIAG